MERWQTIAVKQALRERLDAIAASDKHRAWQAGRAAFKSGQKMVNCPYAKGALCVEWQEGFGLEALCTR